MLSQLPATHASRSPPIQSTRVQATLPLLGLILLRHASLPPLRTFLLESPVWCDRPKVSVKPTSVLLGSRSRVSEVSTNTARLTSCALGDSAAPRNNLWSLTLSKRLHHLFAEYSKNIPSPPDDLKMPRTFITALYTEENSLDHSVLYGASV